MDQARRFIWVWVVTMLLLGAAVAVCNLLVDPYDVFGSPRIAGFNRLKPEAKNHSMLAKTYQIERIRPETVMIGSSRVHIGIDADDPAWPATMGIVYNYAIPGGYDASANLLTLREAIATGRVKNAVVFLDFQNFLVPAGPNDGGDEDTRRMLVGPSGAPNPDRARQVASDMFLALFTMGALVDSGATIAAQGGGTVLDLRPNGSSTDADFVNAARSDGMYDIFAQKDEFEAARAEQFAKATRGRTGPTPNLDVVAGMIALCRAHGVALTLVISPSHADALELYWRNGLWDRIEQFKTDLAALVSKDGGGAVTLWDFMGYDRETTEPVPPAGDRRSGTHWFWESTHFKKAYGHILLGRLFGGSTEAVGARLTAENVTERNSAVRLARQAMICGGTVRVLTSLANAPPDGCAR